MSGVTHLKGGCDRWGRLTGLLFYTFMNELHPPMHNWSLTTFMCICHSSFLYTLEEWRKKGRGRREGCYSLTRRCCRPLLGKTVLIYTSLSHYLFLSLPLLVPGTKQKEQKRGLWSSSLSTSPAVSERGICIVMREQHIDLASLFCLLLVLSLTHTHMLSTIHRLCTHSICLSSHLSSSCVCHRQGL